MRRSLRQRFGAAATIVFAAALTLLAAPTASGHNSLIDSTPADGSVIKGSLEQVELVFDQPVQNEFPQVAVVDEDETSFGSGDPEIVGETVTQQIDALPDGDYTISYRVLSADGHPVDGSFAFSVTGSDARQSPEADPAAGNDDGSGGAPIGMIAGIGGIVLVGLLLTMFAMGNKRRTKRERITS